MDVCRIIAQYREAYRIADTDGEHSAVLAGRLRHEAVRRSDLPAVGDFVSIRRSDHDGATVIEAVLPRKTVLMRRAAGDRPDDQVIAANIDVVFVMLGLDHDFNVRRLERYLAAVWESGATPVVLLNKSDICDDREARLDEVRHVAIGVDVHVLSARTAQGFDTLQPYLMEGVTAGFVGSSGVGKSTLLNRLLGRDVQATRDVREHDSRGRHTTTRRELFALAGGAFVIDTPGMREFQLTGDADLESAFADIDRLAAQCRFSDCTHRSEPGCAVREHVAPDRLRSYEKLLREQRTAAERKQAERLGSKAIRQMKRARGR